MLTTDLELNLTGESYIKTCFYWDDSRDNLDDTLEGVNGILSYLQLEEVSSLMSSFPSINAQAVSLYIRYVDYCEDNDISINNSPDIRVIGKQVMISALDEEKIKERLSLALMFSKDQLLYTQNTISFQAENGDVLFLCYKDAVTRQLYLSIEFLQTKSLKAELYSVEGNKVKKRNYKTYIFTDYSLNLFKIGKSEDPVYRERTLQGEKPSIRKVLIINKNIEAELHEKYKEKRIRGEWFKLTPQDVDEIKLTYQLHILEDNDKSKSIL